MLSCGICRTVRPELRPGYDEECRACEQVGEGELVDLDEWADLLAAEAELMRAWLEDEPLGAAADTPATIGGGEQRGECGGTA